MPLVLPPQNTIDAIHASTTKIIRRVDIYQRDNVTLWKGNVPIVTGAVSIDQTRAERRTLELTIGNTSKEFSPQIGGLWYDKVIKVYRGIELSDGTQWTRQLGEFVIDNISQSNSPSVVKITARDFTKRLMLDKFERDTMFTKNDPVEEIIRNIALNGGIEEFDIILTGKNTQIDFFFELGEDRWTAINKLTEAHGLEAYFNHEGALVVAPIADPALGQQEYTFRADEYSNLTSIDKSSSDSRLFNHIVVTGQARENQLPAWGEAKNTDPGSPTSIDKIGDRVHVINSSFIVADSEAQNLAQTYLSVYGLEQFEVNLSGIVAPYLEVGIVVEFMDPDPAPGAPTKYLLSNLSIPLTLDEMTANVKRLVIVS